MKHTNYRKIFTRPMFRNLPLAYGLGFLFAIVFVVACNDDPKSPGYEYMPDMYRSPSYETNSSNPNFSDSMTARKPVPGTIPRGFMPYPYPNTKEGYEAAGKELKNPLMHNDVNLAEGKRLFENFCIHCHGAQGMGDGLVTTHGFPPPPAYSGALKDLPEGKMFHTITYGKNLMGSHASQLNQEERWKIIMYVQTLQKLGQSDSAMTASTDSTKKHK